jgi:hypothetical protein
MDLDVNRHQFNAGDPYELAQQVRRGLDQMNVY